MTSRDAAGNTTVDDNHGDLYTFTTQTAPQPPWSDNLESGAPGWTVVPDPVYGSDINWTLGTPHNGLQNRAHSGTNAWGSDLNGQSFSLLASSFLYSPVIDLSGVSQATLTFWHSFDFSSGLEDGQLRHQHQQQHVTKLDSHVGGLCRANIRCLGTGNGQPDALCRENHPGGLVLPGS